MMKQILEPTPKARQVNKPIKRKWFSLRNVISNIKDQKVYINPLDNGKKRNQFLLKRRKMVFLMCLFVIAITSFFYFNPFINSKSNLHESFSDITIKPNQIGPTNG